MHGVQSHWRGHLQRPINREAAKDRVPARFLAQQFAKNKTMSLNASSMSKHYSDSLRNDPMDNHTRPGGSDLRCQGQGVKIHQPWKDSVFDSRTGSWIRNDPRMSRQFKRTNSDIVMVVTEPLRDQPPDVSDEMSTTQSPQAARTQYGSRPKSAHGARSKTGPTAHEHMKIAAALGIPNTRSGREEFLHSYSFAARSGGPPSTGKGRLARPASAPSVRRSASVPFA